MYPTAQRVSVKSVGPLLEEAGWLPSNVKASTLDRQTKYKVMGDREETPVPSPFSAKRRPKMGET